MDEDEAEAGVVGVQRDHAREAVGVVVGVGDDDRDAEARVGVHASAQSRPISDSMGCSDGQGYAFARPLEPDAFVDWALAHAATPPVAAAAV